MMAYTTRLAKVPAKVPAMVIAAGIAMVLATAPGAVRADELSDLRARNAQLEATVEELTLQLADAVKERRRLEAQLAEALAAAEAAAVAANESVAAAVEASAAVESRLEDVEVAPAPDAAPAAVEPSSLATAAAAAPEAERVARSTLAGCNVSEALAGYDGKRAGNEALAAWLKTGNNLERCTR
ncbi:MAG: hypothetical protein V2I82_12740, partial [Halieaceae bacterium]|nr:hypothetical protein [Halieaceae bacterium]